MELFYILTPSLTIQELYHVLSDFNSDSNNNKRKRGEEEGRKKKKLERKKKEEKRGRRRTRRRRNKQETILDSCLIPCSVIPFITFSLITGSSSVETTQLLKKKRDRNTFCSKYLVV